MTTQVDEKQVGETYVLQFDFTPRLLPNEIIDHIDSFDLENQGLVTGSTDIVLSSQAHDGAALAQCSAAGGTHKEKYLVTCFVITNLGSRLECEQYLFVRNKP